MSAPQDDTAQLRSHPNVLFQAKHTCVLRVLRMLGLLLRRRVVAAVVVSAGGGEGARSV